MAEEHESESPGIGRPVNAMFVVMVVFLGLSVIASIMDHVNLAVALAGIGGLAMFGMFTVMIGATFLPLPDFPMVSESRSHHPDVDDTPTIH